MKPLIIYGVGDLASQMHYYVSEYTNRTVIAFCVDKAYLKNHFHLGLQVVAFENIQDSFPPQNYDMLLTIGYKSMRKRELLFNNAKSKGYKLINFIHPNALFAPNLEIGENNIILSNVNIEPNVKLGNNNIIWSDCLICHDVTVGSHNFIAAKSLIGGFSKIANKSFLGFNSTIIENVSVDEECLIAAKSLILKNTMPYSKYKGIPGVKYGNTHENTGIELF